MVNPSLANELDTNKVDVEPHPNNQRKFSGKLLASVSLFAALYSLFHILSLNGVSISSYSSGLVNLAFLPNFPLETWNYRIVHITGAIILGCVLFSASSFTDSPSRQIWQKLSLLICASLALLAVFTSLYFVSQINAGKAWNGIDLAIKFNETWLYGVPLCIATAGGVVTSWLYKRSKSQLNYADLVLVLCAIAVAIYLILIYGTPIRQSTGTSFAPVGISFAAIAGVMLIIELTRRMAGLALVVIAILFLCYMFAGQYLPGFLNSPSITWQRFFSQLYTDAGILGPTTAVSSTYIILFIIFAGFLQASHVGEYFISFAFAAAGRARGGPAKVAVFASGLMGMINGTSAGNVVATGSLTIPLMKKVGYGKRTSGAIEAAASTGGQIMPPIMGAGAFIMAEVTGIPYTDIAVAAIIPAILYFISVVFMVDLAAAKLGMRGMRADELPNLKQMAKKVFLFIPIIILIVSLFMGYSVIRAGTLATAAAAVVSWLTPSRMGWREIIKAFEIAGKISIQIIAVCACAGIIVGVISLSGVGARFSSLLLTIAANSQLLAMLFAMGISLLLGMGMPTTAAYAVAASVVAPGLIDLGVPLLTAHFFVFYYAVISAITPPVALASYAAAGIAGSNPMGTSVESFKLGLSAFIVPFMFFYNSSLLMQGETLDIARTLTTAIIGVFMLSVVVQNWFWGAPLAWFMRLLLLVAALLMIEAGVVSDLLGISLAAIVLVIQRLFKPQANQIIRIKGAD